jgi:periplasmic glucans biosynthesis protein
VPHDPAEAIDRRSLLSGAAAAGVLAAARAGPAAADAAGEGGAGADAARAGQILKLGPAAPYSFELLNQRARELARRAYVPPPRAQAEVLDQIDYDAHGRIRFRSDLALWAAGPCDFPVTFFHLGRFFRTPVRIYVAGGGEAREIIYDEDYFDMPANSPARRLAPNSGFAGFKIHESRNGKLDWRSNDWAAFLGASYFRAIGELRQYGLSARGVALDTAVFGTTEEFPDFTHFFFETPAPGSDAVTVCALLDGPGITGAFRFVMRRNAAVVMDVEQTLHLRRDVARLGIAPLTSMFWFSETSKPSAVDWRPEIHDSDGLALWTGAGERIWRPLNNPPRTIASAFVDERPRGFGLMQRDREFDHYQDGVYYDRRPSLWIEPIGNWGRGAVQLIEIPTDDEIHDNVVAMWVPAEPARAGQAHTFRYRMHWLADEPYAPRLARCIATRLGKGGQPGLPRPKGVRKFLVEFKGEPLARLSKGVLPRAVLWASRGEFSYVRTEPVPNDVPGHWRAQFDLAVTGTDPVELRCYLRNGDDILSETWLYQYHPPF